MRQLECGAEVGPKQPGDANPGMNAGGSYRRADAFIPASSLPKRTSTVSYQKINSLGDLV